MKAVNVGVAAHITAASQEGPRFDASLTAEQRCHANNGIWLCQNCAKLVDNDVSRFSANVLRAWKEVAENRARNSVGKTAAPTLGAQLEPKIPSLVFVFGAPLGDNDSSTWIMMLKHYGPVSAHNCTVAFFDDDRKNIEHQWLVESSWYAILTTRTV